jgi:hypothetical protein
VHRIPQGADRQVQTPANLGQRGQVGLDQLGRHGFQSLPIIQAIDHDRVLVKQDHAHTLFLPYSDLGIELNPRHGKGWGLCC